MRALLPAAALFAVLMTAGSSVALIDAVDEVAAFGEGSVDSTLAFGSQVIADGQSKTGAFAEDPDQAVAFAQFLAENHDAQVAEAAALAAAVVNSATSDPAVAWTLVRDEADNKWDVAWTTAGTGAAIASNLYATAYEVAALELDAIGGADDAAQACAGAERPLACFESYVHALVEA